MNNHYEQWLKEYFRIGTTQLCGAWVFVCVWDGVSLKQKNRFIVLLEFSAHF